MPLCCTKCLFRTKALDHFLFSLRLYFGSDITLVIPYHTCNCNKTHAIEIMYGVSHVHNKCKIVLMSLPNF